MIALNPASTAVVSVDLHRGHLDPSVATMPLPDALARDLARINSGFLSGCRHVGVPIVHVVTTYRDVEEIESNPFWRTRASDPTSTRRGVLQHNLIGSPGCELLPEVWRADTDLVVATKKRYDAFLGTDLELLLHSHGVETVLLTGVNTNSCILATAASGSCRDFRIVVVEDCVGSMDGAAAHAAALDLIRIAFGWVVTSAEVLAELRRDPLGQAQ